MTDRTTSIAKYMYWGAAPFVSAAFLVWVSPSYIAEKASIAFALYSAVILGFMAGTLWRPTTVEVNAMEPPQPINKGNDIAIFMSLVAVFGVIASELNLSLSIVILGIGYICLPKAESLSGISFERSYKDLRAIINRTVIISHLSVLVYQLQAT